MERKGFKFYKSYWDVASDLDAPDFKEFISAMCIYYFDGTEPTFSNPMIEKYFCLVRPNIDSNIKRQSDGAKGGRTAKKSTDSETVLLDDKPMDKTSGLKSDKPVVNTTALSDIDIDIDKDIDKDIDIELFKDVPEEIKTAMIEYQEWRVSAGKGYKSKNAVTREVNRLQSLAPDNYQEQNAIIYQALDGGYTGFVSLRANKKKTEQNSSRLNAADEFARGGC